jgi:hypothetical protein
VLEENELLTNRFPSPPLLPQKTKIFAQFFTDDGTDSGSEDMGISGVAASVDFYIPAKEKEDLYISKIDFLLGYGSSAYLFNFVDSGNPLTNGVRIFYTNSKNENSEIENLKTNYDFLRFALNDGIIPTAWELRNLGAIADYGYICSVDLTKSMYPYGVKLDRGTKQRMTITIRDDCTDADLFNCKAFGFERFE